MRLAIVVLVGCGGASSGSSVKPISIQPVAATTAPAPVCIRQPEEAAPITHATADDSSVSFCVGTAVDQCFKLSLQDGTLASLSEPPKAQDRSLQPMGHVETTNPDLKVCNDNGCKTLTPQIWPGAAPLHAATNGAIAAVMLGNAEAGKGYVDVYDVMKQKKLATFKYAHGQFKCGDVAVLDSTIYVSANACTSPSARGALYTTKGKKIAAIGGGKGTFGTYGGAYTQIEGSTWAFLNENGNTIAIQDVAKGKVIKTIDVGQLFGSARMGNPGESAIVRVGSGTLAVIGGTPANGTVAVIDVASGAVKVVNAALCGTSG